MVAFTHTIAEELGMHARPAGLLVKKAKDLNCTVTIACGEKSCDARQLMRLMSLGARKGDMLQIQVEGENEQQAAAELQAFLGEVL